MRVALLVATLVLLLCPSARAAWPGANGRLAYDRLTSRGMEVRTSTLGGHRRRTIATIPPQPAGLGA